jgi:UDP-N-acetylglucosamine 2-epimerase (non-hydrolysing)
MLIDIIVGARPNFVKIAPIIKKLEEAQKKGINIYYRLIHTGQHYDKNMSESFFEQLNIPNPDINMEVGSGTQAEQTSAIMLKYEQVLLESKPALCLVVGDVNSTVACAITAQKNCVQVAHVEAGIRSGDWSMPEEINRLLTDSITNYFFTTSEKANQNLLTCGISKEQIFFVGNTMIDTLLSNMNRFRKPKVWEQAGLQQKEYIIITLHRPSNVDNEDKLKGIINQLIVNSRGKPLVFPVHPRTAKILDKLGLQDNRNLYLIEPLSYLEFNYLVKYAKAIVTDSGGITEEATVMGVPCMTLRSSTERPETIEIGTNELLGEYPNAIKKAMDVLFAGMWKSGGIPPLWDGKAAERIVDVLLKLVH